MISLPLHPASPCEGCLVKATIPRREHAVFTGAVFSGFGALIMAIRPTNDCVHVPGGSNAQAFLILAAISAFSQQLAYTCMPGARTASPYFGDSAMPAAR